MKKRQERKQRQSTYNCGNSLVRFLQQINQERRLNCCFAGVSDLFKRGITVAEHLGQLFASCLVQFRLVIWRARGEGREMRDTGRRRARWDGARGSEEDGWQWSHTSIMKVNQVEWRAKSGHSERNVWLSWRSHKDALHRSSCSSKGSRSTQQYLSRIASFRGDRTGAFAVHHWTALGRISFPFWLFFARLHHQPSEPK